MLSMADRRLRSASDEHIADQQPVAFYRRVSNDELREKGTIENQRQYLHTRYATDMSDSAPHPMRLVADFADDGVSGALALHDRPEGRRLLEIGGDRRN